MKITLHTTDAQRLKMREPYVKAAYVEGREGTACPHCKASPIRARSNEHIVVHDREVHGSAYCMNCEETVGKLVVKMNTLFGLEEDRRVMIHGRCRVY